MASSHGRYTNSVQASVNLYCAQCESQLGIFDNEWIRLTTSYARSKEKGTHIGTEVGNRTQVVPSGPTQRSAEGCLMAEVFCRRCSNMVGQYCKSAPDASKTPLVDQYFYKLSRTFLKDSRTNVRVDPAFGFGSDTVKPASSRSSAMPRASMVPTSRWANTPLRQSSRTPVGSLNGAGRDSLQPDVRDSRFAMTETMDDKHEQSLVEIQSLRDDMVSQQSLLQQQAKQITAQAKRLDDQDEQIAKCVATIEDHENCLSAQAGRIVEQDESIKHQTERFEYQELQLSKITSQLLKLQKTMNDLRSTLVDSRQTSSTQARSDSEPISLTTQAGTGELKTLRAENQRMKLKLSTIANAMGLTRDTISSEIGDTENTTVALSTSHAVQLLGKRKRNGTTRLSSVHTDNAALTDDLTVQFQVNAEQMPTPQSSEGGQQSPEQTPFPPVKKTTNAQREADQSDSTNQNNRTTNPASKLANAMSDLEKDASTGAAVSFDLIMADNNVSQLESGRLHDVNEEILATRKRNPRRRSGRLSQSRTITETSDDSPAHSLPNESRRATRASTRAADVIVDGTASAATSNQTETQPLTNMSALSWSDDTLAQPSLPTIQMASSILGMNLEALIASSQALAEGINPPNVDANLPEINNHPSVTTSTVVQTSSQHSSAETQNNFLQLGNDDNTTGDGGGQIEFIQDEEAYNVVDTSDDDDDLMQSRTDLYGNDALAVENGVIPERNDANVVHVGAGIVPHGMLDMVSNREDRSMAPEPIPRKRQAGITKRPITLDFMHIATPRMFTEAYAAGREPKAVRPPVIQSRERDLNEELVMLGLSEWIGKSKNCKAYTKAVTAARARFRNYNKAAILWSRGLKLDVSDPSSTLPEKPVSNVGRILPDLRQNDENHGAALGEVNSRGEVYHTSDENLERSSVQDTVPLTASGSWKSTLNNGLQRHEQRITDRPDQPQPLSEVENVPAAPRPETDDTSQNLGEFLDEENATEAQPRTTRARTRRSSISLVGGLEEANERTTITQKPRVSQKRTSIGRRKSQRKPDIISTVDQSRIQTVDAVPDKNLAPKSQDTSETATTVIAPDVVDQTSDQQRRKSSGRGRGRPRNSTVSTTHAVAVTAAAKDLPSGSVDIARDNLLEASVASVQAPLQSPKGPLANSALTEEAKAIQEQQRDEAILMRDRLAKEIMEREDMEM